MTARCCAQARWARASRRAAPRRARELSGARNVSRVCAAGLGACNIRTVSLKYMYDYIVYIYVLYTHYIYIYVYTLCVSIVIYTLYSVYIHTLYIAIYALLYSRYTPAVTVVIIVSAQETLGGVMTFHHFSLSV